MKKALLISLLTFVTSYGFAQSADAPGRVNNAHCSVDPDMPKNAVPAWPKSAYTATQDPSCAPCYEYKNKRGTEIMECPFLIFASANNSALLTGSSAMTVTPDDNGSMDVQSQNSYTGEYPACSKSMYPAHTTPVWPKTAYTPVGNPDCAPCYEYTNKRGTVIMECPYLIFPSEKGK